MPDFFVGLDVGTTGARAVVFDGEARPLGEATHEYPLYTPRPGWAEQDATEVATTAVWCLRRAIRKAGLGRRPRVAIGISGTFHSVMPVDGSGGPIGRAMIWADTRAADDSAEIRATCDPLAMYRRTGCPVHPMYLAPKIRWLRRQGVAAAGYRSIMEYVLHALTGQWACNLSLASGTGMLNLRKRTWDEEVLDVAGVATNQLAPIVETTEVVGRTLDHVAAEIGVDPFSPIVAGAGDGVLSSLGAGCIQPGQMTATVGTSGAVRLIADEPKVDDRARTWCYYLADNLWVAGAAINNAGIAFRWTAEKLLRAGPREYDKLIEWAADVPPGAGGLVFLPFLTGERAPNWNADARGVLFGLAIDHDYRHVARATLEGICFRMRAIADALDEVAGPIAQVRATGGFVRSPFWLQMLADVLERPLHLPSIQEASALGAAELAMVGTDALPDLAATSQFVSVGEPIVSNPANAAAYHRTYDLYQKVYTALGDSFREVAQIQREG